MKHWLPGNFDSATGAFALPVWAAGALAAFLFFLGMMAFARSAQIGRAGPAWRVALVLVGAGLTWILLDRPDDRDQSAARRLIDARATELTLRAIAPGSPLACLEAVANATVEAACEKALFASPEMIAAAVAYVDARLTLLADGLDVAARDGSYGASLERWRRAIEEDRFGVVAHVLATRGCTAEQCPALKLLRDPRRVAGNLRDRSFDANVVLYAATWRLDGVAPMAAAPSGAGIAAMSSPATTGAAPGLPLAGRYELPSASSIPAISIMNPEPPLPAGEANGTNAPAAAPSAPSAAAPRASAPRRQTARETPPPAPQPAPSVPMPLSPPGTLANPR